MNYFTILCCTVIILCMSSMHSFTYAHASLVYCGNMEAHHKEEVFFDTRVLDKKTKNEKACTTGSGVVGGIGYVAPSRFVVYAELEYLYNVFTRIQFSPVIIGAVTKKIPTALTNTYINYYSVPKMNIYGDNGVGVSFVQLAYVGEDNFLFNFPNDTGLAWQVGIGVVYSVIKTVNLDTNSHYTELEKHAVTVFKIREEDSFIGLGVLAGIVYRF